MDPNNAPNTPPQQNSIIENPPAPAAPPAPQPTNNGPRTYTEAELNALVEKARSQEKGKLYNELEELRSTVRAGEERQKKASEEAARAARAGLPAEERLLAELEDLRKQMAEKEAATQAAIQAAQVQQQQYQLAIMREQLIREHQIPAIVQQYVTGSTPEQLLASVGVANAEYAVLRQHFVGAYPQQQAAPTAPPQPPVPQATPYTVPQPVPQPSQVGVTPTAPAPNAGPGAIDIAALTSPQALRDGTYLKHREQVHAYLRQSFTPAPTAPGVRPMDPSQIAGHQMPQYSPQYSPQPMHSIPHAVPQQQHQQLPNGVYQPMGLPTPQPMNPQIPQGVPQYQPHTATTPGADAAMQAAAAAAAAALHNPAQALAQVGSQARALGNHPEYHQNPAATPQVNMSQLTNPQAHPMIRN